MNKLFAKVASLTLGLALVAGAGVALASNAKEAKGVRATDVTNSVTLANGVHDGSEITWTLDGLITIKQSKGTSSTAVNSSYISAPRVYKGHILSFEAASNYVIKGISITVTGTYYGNSMTVGTSVSSNVVANDTNISRTWATSSGGTHIISSTNGEQRIYLQNVASANNVQLRFTALSITYGLSESSDPAISLDNASLSFLSNGAAQTVTVTPNDQFTGTPTVSVSGTPAYVNVSVNGLVLTITPKAVGTEQITVNAVHNTEQASATISITVIDSHGHSADDPYSVAEIIALIDEDTSKTHQSVYVAGIISQIDSYNTSYKSINYWISDDGTTTTQFEAYSGKGLNGADFNSIDDIVVGASVVLCGDAKYYNGTYEYNYNNYQLSYVEPAGKALDHITLSGDYQISFEVGDAFSYEGLVVTASYTVGADAVVTPTSVSTPDMSSVGEKTVTVSYTEGDVTKTAEYVIEVNAVSVKHTVSFNAGEGSGSMASVQVSDGASYELPPCTFTAPEGKVFDHWEVAGVEKTSLESVTADVEVTATWKDAPSEVDATMAPGTNGSEAKVVVSEVEKDAIKVGTSSKGGDMTITVGTGATYVKFYAAAWKGVEGLSLNISGATANPASIDLTADEGIANSSPFTLSGSESSYLFTVVLSNITSETTLTLTTSIAKRFVLWGAVYGSGSTPTPPPAETYTVTYDANGGTGSMSDENSPYNSGAQVTVLECSFSREGYTFDHWDTKADDSGTDYAEGATFNISANTTLYAQWHENGGGSSTAARVYSLVESELDLVDGAKYIIANTDASVALSTTQNSNNRGQADIVISEGKAIVSSDSVQVITLEATAVEGKPWALNVGNGYLYAASNSSNHLKTQTENDDNGRWTISISDGVATATAQGTNSRNILKYNKTSTLFSCYASGQQSISLYRLDFGATLLQNITCDGNGSHEFAEGFDWNDLKAVYSDLPTSEQEALVSASSDGLERYDYLVAKYKYENFAGRTIPSIGRYVPTSNEVDSNAAITIISIVAVTSISAIAVLLVIKKRKTY